MTFHIISTILGKEYRQMGGESIMVSARVEYRGKCGKDLWTNDWLITSNIRLIDVLEKTLCFDKITQIIEEKML